MPEALDLDHIQPRECSESAINTLSWSSPGVMADTDQLSRERLRPD